MTRGTENYIKTQWRLYFNLEGEGRGQTDKREEDRAARKRQNIYKRKGKRKI